MDVLLLEGGANALPLEGSATTAIGLSVFTLSPAFVGGGVFVRDLRAVRSLSRSFVGAASATLAHAALRNMQLAVAGGAAFVAEHHAIRGLQLDVVGASTLSAETQGLKALAPLGFVGAGIVEARLRRTGVAPYFGASVPGAPSVGVLSPGVGVMPSPVLSEGVGVAATPVLSEGSPVY